MRVTKLNVESSSDKKNRKNALPRTIGLMSLALGVALSSIGLWTHFHGESGPSIATYKDDNVYVTASYGEDANIPKDAEMRVYPVTPETDPDGYSQKVMSAMTAIGRDDGTDVANAIYDIGFYVGDDEIEPAAPVAVTIQDLNDGFTAGENIAVVHLGEDNAELLADAAVDENGAVSFTSDKFSDFVFLKDEIALFSTDVKQGPRRVAYFPLDETLDNYEDTGIVAELKGGRLDGYVNGISGKAADFSGSGYIDVTGLDGIDFSEGATISYWSKVWYLEQINWGYAWGSHEPGSDYTGVIQGGYDHLNEIVLEGAYYTKGSDYQIIDGGYGTKEVWRQITVVYSPYKDGEQKITLYVNGDKRGDGKLYVDSIYLKEDNNKEKNLKYLPFHIGHNGSRNQNAMDAFDEFMIYNYALTDEEVQNAYKKQEMNVPAFVWFDGTLGSDNRFNYYQSDQNLNWLAKKEDFVYRNGEWYVKLPGLNNTKYGYKLNGWYDIYSKEYYDINQYKEVAVKDLGDEPGNDTVFYANWWDKDYNFDRNRSKVDEGRFTDANDFVTTHVFDYNELYNAGNAEIRSKSITADAHKEEWRKKDDLVFMNWATSTIGRISFTTADESNSDTQSSYDYFNGVVNPGLWNKGNAEELFRTNEVPLGVNYLGEGDSLYQYDAASGYFYYDSKRNAASYYKGDNRFYVYDSIDEVVDRNDGYKDHSDFLPLNGETSKPSIDHPLLEGKKGYQYEEKDGSINYWFGFSSTISFYLPDDVGANGGKANQVTSGNETKETKDMIFTFSGDDDVWVFVDGRPVLDLGGLHGVTFGNINFSTGEVRQSDDSKQTETKVKQININNKNYHYYDFKNIGKIIPPDAESDYGLDIHNINQDFESQGGLKAGKHTLTLYYMERGSSQANCAVYFNLRPTSGIEIEKTDYETHNPLAGAGFTLQNEKGEYYCLSESSDGNETTALIQWVRIDESIWGNWDGDPKKIEAAGIPAGIIHFTDSEGRLGFYDLQDEKYILRERAASSGYKVYNPDNPNYQGNPGIEITVTRKPGEFEHFEYTTVPNDISGLLGEQPESNLYTLKISYPNKRDYLPLEIVKYGADGNPLEGAVFNLSVEDKESIDGRRLLGTLTSPTSGLLSFDPSPDATDLDYEPDNGKLKLRTDRIYYLVETHAPEGYRPLDEIKFKVTKDGIEIVEVAEKDKEFVKLVEGKITLNLTDPAATIKVALLKKDRSTGEALPDAEFALYGGNGYVRDDDGQLKKQEGVEPLYTGTSNNEGNIDWIDANKNPVDFPELTVWQTYYLVETKEPSGYNRHSVITITVTADGVVASSESNDEGTLNPMKPGDKGLPYWFVEDETVVYSYVLVIPNSTGYELPETGGHGTLIYLLTGFMLMFGSTIVLATKRRLRCTR